MGERSERARLRKLGWWEGGGGRGSQPERKRRRRERRKWFPNAKACGSRLLT